MRRCCHTATVYIPIYNYIILLYIIIPIAIACACEVTAPPVMAHKHSSASPSAVSITYRPAVGGADEILRPTLVTTTGRSYRKLTDITFGKRAGDLEIRATETPEAPQKEVYVGNGSVPTACDDIMT